MGIDLEGLGHPLSQFAWNFMGFGSEMPSPWESLQQRADLESWSPEQEAGIFLK